MKGWFNQVCQLQSCAFDDSDFWWDPGSVDVDDTSLLVYFVDNLSDSVVVRANSGMAGNLGDGGTTIFGGTGNVSEVYVRRASNDSNPIAALAALAFHEAMHNLLRMGKSLHTRGGRGLASATVTSMTDLTDGNKSILAAVMGRTNKQNVSFLN